MRIDASAHLPLMIPRPAGAAAPAATVPDPSALLRVAALAAGLPWPMAEAGPSPAPPALSPQDAARIEAVLQQLGRDAQLAPQRPVGLPPEQAATIAAWLGARALLAGGPVQTAGTPVPGWSATGPAAPPAVAGVRLSLSPTLTALRVDPALLAREPAAEVVLNLLSALSGEPRGRLLLVVLGDARGPADAGNDAAAVANPAAKGPADVLQLLVRGTLRGSDARLIDLSLGLTVQRQTPASSHDERLLGEIRSALEQLAQASLDGECPADISRLAGQSARFQVVLDPAGLWPAQSFLLSGLLRLGMPRDVEPPEDIAEPERDEDDAQDEDGSEPSPDRHPAQDASPPRHPRRDDRPALEIAAVTPLPADGGPPVISGSQWLELELRHWRTQLRQWMSPPAF